MVHEESDAPARLLVATMRGVALIDTAAHDRAWIKNRVTLEGSHVSALLYDTFGRRVYAGTHGQGVFASADFGETWAEASSGLTLTNVFSLERSVHDGRPKLLAGTEPVMLFSSEDDEGTWQSHPGLENFPGSEKWTFPAPPHVAHLKSIALDPLDPDVYYACIEQGALLRSADAGRTWQEISSYSRPDDPWYRDIHKIVPDRRDPRRLIMSTGVGIYRSTDGGTSWEKLTGEDFAIAYPDHLIVSPRDSATVFVSGATTTPNVWRATGTATAMVQRSRDGGSSWHQASNGLPLHGGAAIEAMSIGKDGNRFTLFVGNTNGEIYASYDEASSWSRIAAGLAPVSKAMHAENLT